MLVKTNPYKVLTVLLDHPQDPPEAQRQAVKEKQPGIDNGEYQSILALLEREEYIDALHGDDKILAIHVRPSARARMNEKYDVLLFKMKWDIAKISFGFALGFLARCLIQ